MKKNFTLVMATLLLGNMFAHAQMQDVTKDYISCPDFESCPATEADGSGVVPVVAHWNTLAGTDYSDQGWLLLEQQKNGNGAVIEYGYKVKYGNYSTATEPCTKREGSEGNKALCFTGNAGVCYVSSQEVTLPAGSYRLTVYVYGAYLSTSNPPALANLRNSTGFVSRDGDEYLSTKEKFAINTWEADVIDIQLTEPTTGFFRINYGNSYYILVDDIMLEYENKIITTDLENVVAKAKALDAALGGNDDLRTAIGQAEAYVQNPVAQSDIPVKCEALYETMAAALSTATSVVDITKVYLENPSFETGNIEPWTGTAVVDVLSSALPVTPNIDGEYVVEFENATTSYRLSQTVNHLPAGKYIVDAQLSDRANIQLGTTSLTWQGGKDGLYLRGHSNVVTLDAPGSLAVGATGSAPFHIDNFRLLYAPEAEALQQAALAAAQADGKAFLANNTYKEITGSEREALANASENNSGEVLTLVKTINSAIAAYVDAKSDYNSLASTKATAAAYTEAAYPYAARSIRDNIEKLIATSATSRQNALDLRDELKAACFDCYVSNAYCEGVEDVIDYTSKIASPNATGTSIPVAWRRQNMEVRTDKTAWLNPKTGESDQNVYGVTLDYYRTGKDQTAYMWQTVSGLPAGTYVLSVTFMSTATLHPEVLVNGETIGTLTGVGSYSGGVYGGGWVENVITFEKADDANIELRLQSTLTANYQEWYFDNVRLYCIEDLMTGINAPATEQSDADIYDLSGRRVSKAEKGIYIVGGKKLLK